VALGATRSEVGERIEEALAAQDRRCLIWRLLHGNYFQDRRGARTTGFAQCTVLSTDNCLRVRARS
jgi:hypothetical protein